MAKFVYRGIKEIEGDLVSESGGFTTIDIKDGGTAIYDSNDIKPKQAKRKKTPKKEEQDEVKKDQENKEEKDTESEG